MDVEGMQIGQLAQATDVGVETIRYYERHGLIAQPQSPESGYRRYSRDVALRLSFIRRAKDLGFTLSEIKELLALKMDKGTTCADVRKKAKAKLDSVEAKISHLNQIRDALVGLVQECSSSELAAECPILDVLGEIKE